MPTATRLLVVDDDPDLLKLLTIRLTAAGYAVDAESSGPAALARMAASTPRLVISDLRMDGMDGLGLFEAIQQRHPGLPVIILTAHGTIPDAVDATRRGVFGFLTKPFDGKALLAEVEKALRLAAPASGPADMAWRAAIVTRSPAMEAVLDRARRVAAGDASVLVQGESGTGKELLARAIHAASPRRDGPFVAVNCGAIPGELLESELFGHLKGSFSGATRDHEGLVRAASGGTLFLDEIGDMPLPLQVKLLRVLQEREVRPVGSTTSHAVDIRLVSATHRELSAAIAEGRFREDLYYRLNVVSLELPALAERREDIPLLAQHFLAEIAGRYGQDITGFSPEALEMLVCSAWPGNVRQLSNVIERAVALAGPGLIPTSLMREAMAQEDDGVASLDEARDAFERDYLARLMKATGGNVSAAARIAQRNRTDLYRLLQRHGIDPAQFKTDLSGPPV